jgi:putative PIG3 family NAD(P)H quinone oxidoreductase
VKYIGIRQPGGPEVLTLMDGPVPSPGPGEVLIRVKAAGINRADTYQRKGNYPLRPGTCPIPGLEAAGTVESVGTGVDRWKPGDRVCALLAGGGYAEYAIAPAGQCLPIPNGLTFIEAASLPETFFTVWLDVFEFGALQPGESLLVHGGSSGIGVTAIQLARVLGSTVYVTAGSDEKCAAARDLGATLAINYRTQDFEKEILTATSGRGVDVILDMVGGSYVARNLRSMAPNGRLVYVNYMESAKAELDLSVLTARRLTITGSHLRPQPVERKAAIGRALEERAWPHLLSGKIKPVIDSVFPLEQAADAHRRMESSAHIGKIVLEVD